MKIRVLYGSTYHEISIDSTYTVLQLKEILSSYTNLPSDSQKLVLQLLTHKVTLNNAFPLSQYNLTLSTTLTLKQVNSGSQLGEISRWVNRLVVACQDANMDLFYEILKDYEKCKKESLEVEDLQNILNTPYNGK